MMGMIVEFRAARTSWDRWHDHAASPCEQRVFGRRWRWTVLWEMIWDDWIEHHRVSGTLTEFIEDIQRFWIPLRSRLEDATPYDPAIEILWQEALAKGPVALAQWPQMVRETWTAMASKTDDEAPKIPPTVSVDEPIAEVDVIPTQRSRHRVASRVGNPLLDDLLQDWRDDLLSQGISRSHANNMRLVLVRTIQGHQNDPLSRVLEVIDQTGDRTTRHAGQLWRQWLEQKSEVLV